jgi:hypothetical protein
MERKDSFHVHKLPDKLHAAQHRLLHRGCSAAKECRAARGGPRVEDMSADPEFPDNDSDKDGDGALSLDELTPPTATNNSTVATSVVSSRTPTAGSASSGQPLSLSRP